MLLFAVRGDGYLTIPNNPALSALFLNRSSGARTDAQVDIWVVVPRKSGNYLLRQVFPVEGNPEADVRDTVC